MHSIQIDEDDDIDVSDPIDAYPENGCVISSATIVLFSVTVLHYIFDKVI